jgi:hypothetical protein
MIRACDVRVCASRRTNGSLRARLPYLIIDHILLPRAIQPSSTRRSES